MTTGGVWPSRFTSTDRPDAGSAEYPPPASDIRAACWRGPRRDSGPRVRSRCLPAAADVERHQQMETVIGMAREGQRRQTRLADGDADLFVQFADQGYFRPLARLDLATGEFPQAGQRLALRPLRDQHALVGIDQCAGNHQSKFEIGHASLLQER